MMGRNKVADIHPALKESTKHPAMQEIAEKATLYRRVFDSPEGQKVLADLEAMFNGTTLKKAPDKTIDLNASLAAAGCREVVLYIHYWRDRNATT